MLQFNSENAVRCELEFVLPKLSENCIDAHRGTSNSMLPSHCLEKRTAALDQFVQSSRGQDE